MAGKGPPRRSLRTLTELSWFGERGMRQDRSCLEGQIVSPMKGQQVRTPRSGRGVWRTRQASDRFHNAYG